MSEYREIIIIPAAMFQKVFRLSQSYHGKISGLKGNGSISLRFYAQTSGSNSIAAQQRKKILTYQTTNLADAEGVSGAQPVAMLVVWPVGTTTRQSFILLLSRLPT